MGRAWGLLAGLAGLAGLAASSACAQVPDPWPVEDDGVFVPGSLEKVAEGYNFTEGPAWDRGAGDLQRYFGRHCLRGGAG